MKHIRVFIFICTCHHVRVNLYSSGSWLFLVVEAGPGDADEGVTPPGQLGVFWKVFFNSNPHKPPAPFMCASSI